MSSFDIPAFLRSGLSRLRQMPLWKKALLAALLLLLLLLLLVYSYFHSKVAMLQEDTAPTNTVIAADDQAVQADQAAIEQALAVLAEAKAVESHDPVYRDPNVTNILLIGTDERSSTYSENARGDSCLLLSLNRTSRTASLVSFERGMGVPVLGGEYEGSWDWLTHTFRYGGSKLLLREIQDCFKLDVDYYIRINLAFFEKAIDTIGGVDVSLTEAEATYFRDGHIDYSAHAGMNHLDGPRALAYARLREIDNDWHRIQRQRTVIQAAINQTRSLSVLEINHLVDTLIPMVRTNLTEKKITELLLMAPSMRGITLQQMTIPVEGTYGSMMGLEGRRMFAVDFEQNTRLLREFLYGPESVADASPAP